MHFTTKKNLSLALILAGCLATPMLAAGTTDDFRAGIEASRSGQDSQALTHFEAARFAGLNTPQLHYNMGITYRRLNQPADARRAFVLATRSPELAGPAHYQLGTLAQESGDLREAEHQFQLAAARASTERLRGAARSQLNNLQTGTATRQEPGRGYIALEAGHDSNVATGDDTTVTRSDSDQFLDLLAWGEYRLSQNSDADYRLTGTFNHRSYLDLSEANLTFLQGGIARHFRSLDWHSQLGLQASHYRLDGDALESNLELVAAARRDLGGLGQLQLRARTAQISGGSDYSYLDGRRHDLRIGLTNSQHALPWYLRYDLSLENRDDIHGDNDTFQSSSPTRQAATIGIRPQLDQKTQLNLSATYRHSRYADSDRLADGSSIRRIDKMTRLSALLTRQVGNEWHATARVAWTDNDSNRSVYEYDRVEAALGLERTF